MTRLYTHHLERQLIRALFLTLFLLASLYVYFLSASVLNVVMREEIGKDIAAFNSQIGELEHSYLSQKNRIGLNDASTLGFVKIADKRFVERYSLTQRGLTLDH